MKRIFNIKFYYWFSVLGLVATPVYFFSSCGLVGSGGSLFGNQDSQATSNAGNGATPQLKSRIEANPRLANKNCEDYSSCKSTCKKIYDERDSLDTCYNLSVGRASELEEVWTALFNARAGDDEGDLEDIDTEHFEKYLEIGLDGVLEKLIPEIEDKSNKYARLKNILEWIVEEEDVVSVLESEDGDNEILEALILAHCDIANDLCTNSDSDIVAFMHQDFCRIKLQNPGTITDETNKCYDNTATPTSLRLTCPQSTTNPPNEFSVGYATQSSTIVSVVPWTSGDTSIFSWVFRDHSSGGSSNENYDHNHADTDGNSELTTGIVFMDRNLIYCSMTDDITSGTSSKCTGHTASANAPCTTLTHKKLGEVEEDEKDLFIALIGAGQVFFEHSADEGQESAFALGHALLKKACNAGSATSKAQCVAGFYCFLQGSISGSELTANDWFNEREVRDKLDETVDLKSCAYDTSFTAL